MKFDAEFLKKNLFWVLLVGSVPLVFVALIVLNTSVAGTIETERTKITLGLDSVKKKMKEVKTQGEVELAKKRAEDLKKQETEVWKKAYAGQEGLMVWPDDVEEFYHFQDGYFAREIQAEPKGGDAKEEPPPAPEGENKEGKTSFTHTGVIQSVYADWIEVKGLDKPLRLTKGVKITLTDDKGSRAVKFTELTSDHKVKATYEIGKYFGDELTDNELKLYHEKYKTQIHPILKQVQPITTKGDGVVQLGDWLYTENDYPKAVDPFFNYFPGDLWLPNPHLSKEAWTAQEDLWIQNELYRQIALANDYVATFDKQPKGDPQKKFYVFTNSYWQLELQLDTEKRQLNLKMTNTQPRTQAANVTFKIKIADEGPPLDFAVQGGSLPYNGSMVRTKSVPATAKDILEVKQVLTWETAGVKRIQQISLGSGKRPGGDVAGFPGGTGQPPPGIKGMQGAGTSTPFSGGLVHSHRTLLKGLSAFFKPTDLGPPVEGGAVEGTPPMGGTSGTDKKEEVTISKNGFDFKRYSDLTPQARRVPVCVVLIVDQNHISKVQTAFTNSKLRFLTTQVLLNHYPKNISPLKISSGDSKSGYPGGPGMFGPGMMGPGMYPMGSPSPGGEGGIPTEGFQFTDSTSANMELVLYGFVSLYERFPAREGGPAETTPAPMQ